MDFFIGIIIIFVAYFLIDFYFVPPSEAKERRKEDEKYSFKKMNERINKK